MIDSTISKITDICFKIKNILNNKEVVENIEENIEENIIIKELKQEELKYLKEKYNIDNINKIDERFFNILEFNERKIIKGENIIYSTFQYLVENKINIDVIYENFPKFLEQYLKNEKTSITKIEEEIITKFKNDILNIKLFLFKIVEENLDEFKEFKTNFNNEYSLNDESKARLMILSFYLFKHSLNNIESKNIDDVEIFKKNIKNNINNSIIEAKKLIELDFFNTLLPTKEELNILEESTKELNFKFGFEYEFWMKFNLSNKVENFEKVLNKLNLIDENSKSKKSNSSNKYNIHEIVKEDIKNKDVEQHYFEIITKKFNSTSEMLIFHDLILKTIKQFHIENANNIQFKNESNKIDNDDENVLNNSSIDLKNIEEQKNLIFNSNPGSIHFNISIKDIENIDKVKFFLFLKDSGLMQQWGIRNNNVKDLSSLVDIFGKDVLNLKLGQDTYDNSLGKFWTINFEHLYDENKDNRRIEIRYIGGKNYFDKQQIILNNFLDIINCVKIGNDSNLKILDYNKLLEKYDNFKEFNKLNKDEDLFLKTFLKYDTIGEKINLFNEIIDKIKDYKDKIKKGLNNYGISQ